MPFSDWMALMLYHPTEGYYNREHFSLNKQGDFITAPTLSPLCDDLGRKSCIPC